MTATAKHVVMIDNYDLFTWNIYQYLCQAGARVDVYRNDALSVEEIAALHPDLLLILPGPGSPATDLGVSREAIKYFAGKIPVVGVCMGQQCIYEVFGGTVGYAGEIVHGKTLTIEHDGKGLFAQVPQEISVTRYHSLAGLQVTLPDELEVTAKTASGVIMGVRHKKYTVEGVQFHPESILTESGHVMVRNMLAMTGGTWDASSGASAAPLILDKIYLQRQRDVYEQQQVPGKLAAQLAQTYELGLAPAVVDFHQRLLQAAGDGRMALAAEIKRASPLKGDIDIEANPAVQASRYAAAGAAAILVLTEPHWFKGLLEDLVWARRAVDGLEDRPAILRKEFVFHQYQILEARLAGADLVLLIVKMLSDEQLRDLYAYLVLLGMEPLVEVALAEELKRALAQTKCKVIGVNNRDLHLFEVDLGTTSRLVEAVPEGVVLLALSGVSGVEDVRKYKQEGVHGVLVGEALMRAGEGVEEFASGLINA